MSDDIRNSENIENISIKSEEKLDDNNKNADGLTENEEARQENCKEDEKGFQKKSEADEKEGGSLGEEGNNSEKKTQTHKENISEEKKRFSQQKPRSLGAGIIALIIALTLLVTALVTSVGLVAVDSLIWLGRTAYSILTYSDRYEQTDADIPMGDMNVIKNDGSINVNEQIGSTGHTGSMTISQVVDLVADTVVEIKTAQVVNDGFYGQYVTSGAGSGVIITENGYIVTNYHVIEGAREVTVRLTDGKEYAARIIGGDAERDIAVVKINATGLPFAVMGSSKDLVVGQDVIAIGNPLGSLGGTVTDGIISALDRTVMVGGHRMTLMQTNAAINPGNSGGGLFDMSGQLIGIVNAKQSDTGIEGLGFAIPIDIAWDAVKDIVEGNY